MIEPSQSFANEISRMKILQMASWPWKPWKLHPLKVCTYTESILCFLAACIYVNITQTHTYIYIHRSYVEYKYLSRCYCAYTLYDNHTLIQATIQSYKLCITNNMLQATCKFSPTLTNSRATVIQFYGIPNLGNASKKTPMK